MIILKFTKERKIPVKMGETDIHHVFHAHPRILLYF